MKLTTSYPEPTSIFGFEEESPFNFEETQNKSLADLIPEIDALCGAVQYPSFECFEQNLFEGNAEDRATDNSKERNYDQNIEDTASLTTSMKHSEGVYIKDGCCESKEIKENFQAIQNLIDIDRKSKTLELKDYMEEIKSEKAEMYEENTDGVELQNSEKKDINQIKLRAISNKDVRKNRTGFNKVDGVKLERWGREEDRQTFSYWLICKMKSKLALLGFLTSIISKHTNISIWSLSLSTFIFLNYLCNCTNQNTLVDIALNLFTILAWLNHKWDLVLNLISNWKLELIRKFIKSKTS